MPPDVMMQLMNIYAPTLYGSTSFNVVICGAAMFMSKAFYMVEWVEMFESLLERKVDSILMN